MSNTKSVAVARLLKNVSKSILYAKDSKIPLIDDHKLHKEVDEYIDANKKFKEAKVALEIAEKPIIKESKDWYKTVSGKENSVRYAGNSSAVLPASAVLVTYKDAFSKINSSVVEELKAKLKNKFDYFFKEKRTIKLKEEATGDDTIDFLLSTLGETKFVEIFDVDISTVVVKNMDAKQFELTESIRGLIKQHKPALRVS